MDLSAIVGSAFDRALVAAAYEEWERDGVEPCRRYLGRLTWRGGVGVGDSIAHKTKLGQVLRGGIEKNVEDIGQEEMSPGGELL